LREAGLALRLMPQAKGVLLRTYHWSSTAKRDFSSKKSLGEEEVLAALEMTARVTARK